MVRTLLPLFAALAVVLACPEHDIRFHESGIQRRSEGARDWTYDASYNWGSINENYTFCQNGTQQSPIPLSPTDSLSHNHGELQFNYPDLIEGILFNWGYGPSFTVNATSDSLSSRPSITFDNETVYLKGWHTHAPSDHRVQGEHSKAELHLVHANEEGHERAVVSIRINPGSAPSPFVAQFPAFPSFDSRASLRMKADVFQAVKEVDTFHEYWEYQGSLTSPPCTEGIRWFVARDVLLTSVEQMQELLGVSTYSARVEQEVWQHYAQAQSVL